MVIERKYVVIVIIVICCEMKVKTSKLSLFLHLSFIMI